MCDSHQQSFVNTFGAVLNNVEAGTYQEASFHEFEHAALHVSPHHSALVDHHQAVAHCNGLPQPVAPAKGCLL